MKFARMENGVVVETVEAADADEIAARYHPDLGFTACPGGVAPGWTYDGSKFAPPKPDPDMVRRNARATAEGRIAEVRMVAMDYFAAGQAMPPEWVAYRAALVAIRDNPPTTAAGLNWPNPPANRP